MQDFEKELADLKFAKPPKWLKARAVLAAQTGHESVARRHKRLTFAVAAVAAVMFVALVGQHILGAFGLMGGSSGLGGSHEAGSGFTAGPANALIKELRSEAEDNTPPSRPAGTTTVRERTNHAAALIESTVARLAESTVNG